MIIAIEGIDGSGKQTQGALLAEALESKDLAVGRLAFPRYEETFFGQSVRRYLNGDFGPLTSVAPEFAALLFAGDRFESKTRMTELIEHSDVLLLDRYVGSNMAHQGARVPPHKRHEFLGWVNHLEHEVYDLPRPDLTLFLDVPVSVASANIARRHQQSAPAGTALDLHEVDNDYLELCRAVYLDLMNEGEFGRWVSVPCVSGTADHLDPPEEIAARVWHIVHRHLFFAG